MTTILKNIFANLKSLVNFTFVIFYSYKGRPLRNPGRSGWDSVAVGVWNKCESAKCAQREEFPLKTRNLLGGILGAF